jgi:hypothetical protein
MKQRCNCPSNEHYKDYGGRGITYSPEWEYFQNFLQDMGNRPPGHSLERIDNNGNYCKENCKWADYDEQARNRRLPAIRTESGERRIYQNKRTGKWYSRIDIRTKSFATMEEAICARDKILQRLSHTPVPVP